MSKPSSKPAAPGGPPSGVPVSAGDNSTRAIPSDRSPKPGTEQATLGQMGFSLVILSEDESRRAATAEPGSCVPNGRNPDSARNYRLRLLLKTFEAQLNKDQPEDSRIYLKFGQLGYGLRGTFRVIKKQEHFEIAVNYLFSARENKNSLDFEFHVESAKEKAVRESVEKASQRNRAYKTKKTPRKSPAVTPLTPDAKQQPIPTALVSEQKAPVEKNTNAKDSKPATKPATKEAVSTPKKNGDAPQSAALPKDPLPNSFKVPTAQSPIIKTLTKRIPSISQIQTTPPPATVATTVTPTPWQAPPESSYTKKIWKRFFRDSFSLEQKSSENTVQGTYQDHDARFKSVYTAAGTETFVRGLNEEEEPIPKLADKADVDVSEDALDFEPESRVDWTSSEYLMRQLHALQNSEELSQVTASEEETLYRWRECCRMFQISSKNVGIDERVKISGLKSQLYQYQAFAVYWQMITSRKVGGGFVGDEMGLGKTLTFLAFIVVERQLAWLWQDIAKSRRDGDGRHLSLDQQSLDHSDCPSNSERRNWIACPCVASNPTSQMPAKHGVRMACVPPPLISSWVSQWKTHIDEDETTLGMSLAVAYPPSFAIGSLHENNDARRLRNVMYLCAAKVKIQAQSGVIIDSPKPNQERFLLLTTADVYKPWARKTFEYETTGISTDKDDKKSYVKQKNQGIIFGIAMVDECHDEYLKSKGKSSVLVDLSPAERPFLWGYSGTPVLNTPRGLESVRWAKSFVSNSITKTGWEQDPEMRQFNNKTLEYLCTAFESQIKSRLGSKKSVSRFPERLMPFLTTFMIRRTAESSWFGHPLVRLKPHYHHDVKLKHKDFYHDEFNKFISMLNIELDNKLAELQEKWDTTWGAKATSLERVHTVRPKDVSLNTRCQVCWKLHIFLTFPYLVNLALLPPEDPRYLDFSAKECIKWAPSSSEKRSPYYKNLRSIVESSSKCMWLYGFIKQLMETRDVHGREQKLVILTRFNTVALVIKLFIETYIPSTVKRVGLVITGTQTRARTAILESFVDTLQPNGQPKHKNSIQFLVGTTSLIGKGLDLGRAANVVLMEPDFEFRREMQAYSRIHRIGQENEKTDSWRLTVDNKYLEDYEYHNPEWKIVKRQWERRELVGRKVPDKSEVNIVGRGAVDAGIHGKIGEEKNGKGKERRGPGVEDIGPMGETLSDLDFYRS